MQKTLAPFGKRAGNEVAISATDRYFDLISTSLFSVEPILAQRLSRVGRFDPAGVVAEIDRATLDQRIARAAKSVCGVSNRLNAQDALTARQCIRTARNAANAEIAKKS